MSTEQQELIGTEVAVRGETAVATEADGPEQVTSLVQLAIEKGVDVEVLERLVALQERVTERQAEQAMAEALAAFQAECPPIPRVRTADVRKRDGTRAYSYHFAPLEEIVRVIRPHLQANGLSYTHDGEVDGGQVRTTCVLQHIAGATRTATFTAPVDNSGGKNPLQAVGSARSYGRRYTLIDVLGLITEDDDDGVRAGAAAQEVETVDADQLDALEEMAREVGANVPAFCRWLGVPSLADLPAHRYDDAMAALEKKRKGADS